MVTMFDPFSQFGMVAKFRTMTCTTTELGKIIIDDNTYDNHDEKEDNSTMYMRQETTQLQ
eukprot:3883402-Amphidinium_carterae.1